MSGFRARIAELWSEFMVFATASNPGAAHHEWDEFYRDWEKFVGEFHEFTADYREHAERERQRAREENGR